MASIIHQATGSLKLAQSQLGHSKISTTSDIYTHVDDLELERSSSALNQALAPEKDVVEMLYDGGSGTSSVQ